jgi:hypothetical protein
MPLVLLFLAGFMAVAFLVTLFSEVTDAPLVFWHIGIERTPIFSLIFIWMILVGSVPVLRADGYHDVGVVERCAGGPASVVGCRLVPFCMGFHATASTPYRTVAGNCGWFGSSW